LHAVIFDSTTIDSSSSDVPFDANSSKDLDDDGISQQTGFYALTTINEKRMTNAKGMRENEEW
jgi:hypothetical protein